MTVTARKTSSKTFCPVGSTVRLTADVADKFGRTFPTGTEGTISLAASTGYVVKAYLAGAGSLLVTGLTDVELVEG